MIVPDPGPSVSRRNEDLTVPAWERIAAKLAADSAKAHRGVIALLVVLTLELAFAIASAHCPSINSMVCDVFTLLDGGYRVTLGQRPHVDFYSPLGAFCLLLLAGGIKMGGFASAFAYVHAGMVIAVVAWTWALLRSRTSAVLTGVVAVWLGVLAVAPRSLGFPPPMITYAMQYNRWGWALLSVAFIELFLPRRDGSVRIAAGVSTGVIAGLLLLLKANYFAAVVLAILLRLIVSRFQWKWAAGLVGGFLGVATAGFWYLRFNFAAFMADLRLLASVQHLSTRVANVVQLTLANVPDLSFLVMAMLVALLYARWARPSSTHVLRVAALPVAIAALGIVTCSANYQVLQIPVIYLAIFLLVEQVRRTGSDCGSEGRVAFLMIFLIATGAIAKPLFDDLATLFAAGAKTSASDAPQDWPRLAAAAVSDLRIEPGPRDISTDAVRGGLRAGATEWREDSGTAYPYVLWFNAGADLLRDRVPAHPRVLVFDLSNPFSLALGLTPPEGDALFWHFQRDFDLVHFPDSSRVFHDVTDVMIPKTPVQRLGTRVLQRIYAPVLARDFRVAAENDLWIRYERRGSPTTAWLHQSE
jgi:hypothetical protein